MIELKDVLLQYLEENAIVEKILPIYHTTTYKKLLNDIIHNGLLTTTKTCDYHDGECLMFFFYGKASYQPIDHQGSGANKNHPITFIFDYETLAAHKFERLVCFDSGGYIAGKYIYNEDNPRIEVFTINEPGIDDLIGTLQLLFKDNNNYLKSELDIHYKGEDYPASTFLMAMELLKHKVDYNLDGISEFGEQALTFELQIKDCKIKLEPEAVLMPSDFFSSETGIRQLEEIFPKSKLIPYKGKKFAAEQYASMKFAVTDYSQGKLIL